ncbi:hypothetical protein B879_02861 [Cecembia lonarensis LW9]|uniref:Uncharacterized protein n=1 Tax=Cecembia lonarensis (strain CCUG 58316 / KCTC 22772 / LW9) TaxID=1225176 RepID=K1KWI7_CECL9|nr:hypothetical protein B879_02861 [Cecembia lonarensis LW9]
MLPQNISDEEILFRAIKPFPNWWKVDINRPSSAAFKDSRGVSVDRDAGRQSSRVVQILRARFPKPDRFLFFSTLVLPLFSTNFTSTPF